MKRAITLAALTGAATVTTLAALASSPAHAGQGDMSAQAARSTAVDFVNNSGCQATRWSAELAHGIWTSYPAYWGIPGATFKWESESNGFMTGTEGQVIYGLSNCSNPAREGAWVSMHWDNPYVGSNSYSEAVQALNGANLQLVHTDGSGNNATVTWTLS